MTVKLIGKPEYELETKYSPLLKCLDRARCSIQLVHRNRVSPISQLCLAQHFARSRSFYLRFLFLKITFSMFYEFYYCSFRKTICLLERLLMEDIEQIQGVESFLSYFPYLYVTLELVLKNHFTQDIFKTLMFNPAPSNSTVRAKRYSHRSN